MDFSYNIKVLKPQVNTSRVTKTESVIAHPFELVFFTQHKDLLNFCKAKKPS